jgi:anti-sigma regulatory factor (Ser/Thr protein kinase)
MTAPRSDALYGPACPRPIARPFSGPPRRLGRKLADLQDSPLRSYLELPAVPASVRTARSHATSVLREWHVGAIADTVKLIVSEMTTNAVRASAVAQPAETAQPPRMRLWLTRDRHDILIQVWDGDQRRPACQDPEPDAESGRGLLLIEALSAQWGCWSRDGQDGKIIWAICSVR